MRRTAASLLVVATATVPVTSMPTANAIGPGDPVITTIGGYPVSYD